MAQYLRNHPCARLRVMYPILQRAESELLYIQFSQLETSGVKLLMDISPWQSGKASKSSCVSGRCPKEHDTSATPNSRCTSRQIINSPSCGTDCEITCGLRGRRREWSIVGMNAKLGIPHRYCDLNRLSLVVSNFRRHPLLAELNFQSLKKSRRTCLVKEGRAVRTEFAEKLVLIARTL